MKSRSGDRRGMLWGLCVAAAGMLPAPLLASVQAPVHRMAGGTILPLTVRPDGRILALAPRPGPDGVSIRLLHATTLRSGLGSSKLGLDRGSFGPTRLMVVRRIGDKVALQYENARFRATGASAAEAASVRDSFAASTVWIADVVETRADGSFTFDVAGYLASDAAGIGSALLSSGVKGFKHVEKASLADPGSIRTFPDNVEVHALQTFRTEEVGPGSGITSPDPRQISFVVHHSFVRLPGPGYAARRLDPRVGGLASQAVDFSAPLGDRVVYDLVNRFRLEKVDPTAARSPVKRPIVFHIDRAAPEPIRSALLEGARWWSDAFDRAGFLGGFRAEILPEGADPMDVRYNVVNWVNRETRGWSYGQVVADPRTGEIIKGSVLLGSLRVRQDMLIFDALLGATEGADGPAVRAALARLRQLSAHEIGHALGLVHNFAGSTQGRASVMDYPAPRIGLVGGKPDLSDAYGVGLGAWDRFAIDWTYGQPTSGEDADLAARRKADAMFASGARFVSDADARPAGSAQPWGSLWDDGGEPSTELLRMLEVRRAALDGFGENALRAGTPLAQLRRSFVPIWLLHRYQVEAAAKLLGGVDFDYGVAGSARAAAPVGAAEQERALSALLRALDPGALTVPSRLLPLLSAADEGNPDPQFEPEVMPTAGGPVFDPLVAADVGATLVLGTILEPTRLSRLVLQQSRGAGLPSVDDVVGRLLASTTRDMTDPLKRRIAYRALMSLAGAAHGGRTDPEVAAIIAGRLEPLARDLRRSRGRTTEASWRRAIGTLLLDRERLAEELVRSAKPPEIPPGMPIGSAGTGGWSDG